MIQHKRGLSESLGCNFNYLCRQKIATEQAAPRPGHARITGPIDAQKRELAVFNTPPGPKHGAARYHSRAEESGSYRLTTVRTRAGKGRASQPQARR
jgi:hypothetical protein